MGLFDVFRKKPEEEDKVYRPLATPAAAGSGSPWPGRFRGFSDWGDDRKKEVGKAFLEDMGTLLQSPKVKEVLDEDELELRGRYEDIPIRLKYESDMGWVGLEMKCPSPLDVYLEWDPEKVPVHSDDAGDDWDEEDEVRVFVGKGVFVEGDKNTVNGALAQFASLPAELQGAIVGTMQELRLSRFMILGETINTGFNDNSYEMSDPAGMIGRAVSLMARTARVASSGEVVVGQISSGGARVAIAPVHLVTCGYCRTKFNLGANSRCPNCGGAFQG
jgi:predicted Zn-ribbon and HTH transcriptional regulator